MLRKLYSGALLLAFLCCVVATAAVGVGAASAQPTLHPDDVTWQTLPGDLVQFRLRFRNDGTGPSPPAAGSLHSQPFGVHLPNAGLIGDFDVPTIAPDSFFDVVFEVSRGRLPPNPEERPPGGGPAFRGAGIETDPPCPPDDHWDGNVDVVWNDPNGGGQVNKHFGTLQVTPGAGNSYLHVISACGLEGGWNIVGLCPGFGATLVNEDFSPAPPLLPPGWTGWLCINAAAGVPGGTECCFDLVVTCQGVPGVIDMCVTACDPGPKAPNPVPTVSDWTTDPATGNVLFHVRWDNPDPDVSSRAVQGTMFSQEFGVFAPPFAPIGNFDVPPLPPSSFFDVFFEVPLPQLPPEPAKVLPGGGPGARVAGIETDPNPCPPDDHWDGNVDLEWTSDKEPGSVNYHFGDLLVCPGAGNSYIHVRPVLCDPGATWSVAGLCPGFSATLVNEDFTPAPATLPSGWSGWICVSAAAGTPIGVECCLNVDFFCGGQPAQIQVCATTCDWSPKAPNPVAGRVTWGDTQPGPTGEPVVRFEMRWTNPDPQLPSRPVTGAMASQAFGAFLPDFGPIGSFDVPPIPPESFFDVFFDIPLSELPPEPAKILPGGGPGAVAPRVGTETNPSNCPPDDHWDGNVDVHWASDKEPGQANYHFGELLVCPGAGNSYIHVITGCVDPGGSNWAINGLCPGFNAVLVNEDFTPAPAVLPAAWTGWMCISADPTVATGDSCCFTLDLTCAGASATIDFCAHACDWSPKAPNPVPSVSDWTTDPATGNVMFHVRWHNLDRQLPSRPVQGTMSSQEFGVFAPNFGPIGTFDVPPIPPESFFDVFFDVPLAQLPPSAEERLPGGGTPLRQPGVESDPSCPPDDHWDGNVDLAWTSDKEPGEVNYHFGTLQVAPGGGNSYIHIRPILCGPGSTWSVNGLCPGFSATLVNEDFTPAPALLPSGWSGWICLSADPSVPVGTSCCPTVDFVCNGQPAQIVLCATACDLGKVGVPAVTGGIGLALGAVPNPSFGTTTVRFVVPRAGAAAIEVFDASGKRVRTLLDGRVEAGAGQVVWNGLGDHGRGLSSGVYFLRLSFEGDVVNRRVMLVK